MSISLVGVGGKPLLLLFGLALQTRNDIVLKLVHLLLKLYILVIGTCVYPPARRAGPHGQTESGYRVLAVNAGARAARGGVTRQGVVLTDLFIHFLIVNKTSLSLSLSLCSATSVRSLSFAALKLEKKLM